MRIQDKVKGSRPTPNQGITVPGPLGKPPVTIGGEKPGAIKVQPMTPIAGGPSILRTPVAPKIKGQGTNK
mgnify:CR=1 FL=1